MPLFQLGFRPFYSLASIFAIVSLIVWLLDLTGVVGTGAYLHGVAWHSHEMLYGFAVAVITGFLFTAVRNWTGLPTPTGLALAALAALWLAARVLIVTGPLTLAAAVDLLFLPAIAVAVAIPILRSRNIRNYKVLVVLLALAASHVVFHLASLAYISSWFSRIAVVAGIDIVAILMAIVGGRVIPAFTKNAVPDANPRHEPWVESITFVSMMLVVFITLISPYWSPPPLSLTVLFIVVAASHATRLALWEPARTIGNPLLWMMPAAYSWIPFAFLLRALAAQNIVADGAWIHALTMGAISGLMLAMMMRSSLGHTGHKLVASRYDMAAFVLLQVAAMLRVFTSLSSGETYLFWIVIAGLLWTSAFLVFALRYVPMLSRPRIKE